MGSGNDVLKREKLRSYVKKGDIFAYTCKRFSNVFCQFANGAKSFLYRVQPFLSLCHVCYCSDASARKQRIVVVRFENKVSTYLHA